MNLSFTLKEAAPLMHGRLAGCDAPFVRVNTDSRADSQNALFFALRGERFDGHDFVGALKGAVGAVVDERFAATYTGALPIIVVKDTKIALGALAAAWRARFAIPVVALTGSNGKTTTKEMIAAILEKATPAQVLATKGNLNNDIGLPLTLLELLPQHRYAVVEMGMNHPGEIAYLSRIACPNLALVTNVQRAHLEGMGDLAAVVAEKASIFEGLTKDDLAVINQDETSTNAWQSAHPLQKTLSFSTQTGDIVGKIQANGNGTYRLAIEKEKIAFAVSLPLLGEHNAKNALAAASLALALKIDPIHIQEGLSAFYGVKGRLWQRVGILGSRLIGDTYNPNPDSIRAAIATLATFGGDRIFVLGDMREVGEKSGALHAEIGAYAASARIDALYALGDESAHAVAAFGKNAIHFADMDALIATLKERISSHTSVLVKGSRFMRMERVVEAIAHPTEVSHVA